MISELNFNDALIINALYVRSRCATTASVKKTSVALHPVSSPRTGRVRRTDRNGKKSSFRYQKSEQDGGKKSHLCKCLFVLCSQVST